MDPRDVSMTFFSLVAVTTVPRLAQPSCRFPPPGGLLRLMSMATPSQKSAARLLNGGLWRMDLDC
jgi:hypothetical protein